MSKSVNQVILIGNVGKEPEIRVFENGIKVATFSVATSTGGYKKQDGTDVPEKTSWHNIIAWRGLADISEKFVHKGDKLTVIGSISYREYEKDGVKKFITDILASDLVLTKFINENLDLELLSKRVTVHDTNNRKIFRGYGFFSYVDVYPEGEVNPFITELVIKNLLVNSDGILKVPEHEVKPHMWYIKEVGDILAMIFQYMGSSSETA